MGSPQTEPGRFANEFLHHAEISYDFSLATKVLTFEQVDDLLPGCYDAVREPRPPGFPGRFVSLLDARRLCNRVSENEGLPEDQWCYTTDEEPVPKENITALAGYRFPTEEEWEYACRGGAARRTARAVWRRPSRSRVQTVRSC